MHIMQVEVLGANNLSVRYVYEGKTNAVELFTPKQTHGTLRNVPPKSISYVSPSSFRFCICLPKMELLELHWQLRDDQFLWMENLKACRQPFFFSPIWRLVKWSVDKDTGRYFVYNFVTEVVEHVTKKNLEEVLCRLRRDVISLALKMDFTA